MFCYWSGSNKLKRKNKKLNNSTNPKKIIFIIDPFDALNILTALEFVEERKKTSRSLRDSIREYKKQINDQITNEQIDDANAEFAVRKLLGNY